MGNNDSSALMQQLSEASFFALDLKLYLDTHPDDRKAIKMFREACRQAEVCREAFEKHCYPLLSCSSGDNGEWDWLDGAWPSERM